MVDGPDQVLPRFVSLAMELGEGVSSGISIFEGDASPPVFRWAFLEGSLAAFNGATTPRDYSPCGITLDANRPTLARHAERYYSWISTSTSSSRGVARPIAPGRGAAWHLVDRGRPRGAFQSRPCRVGERAVRVRERRAADAPDRSSNSTQALAEQEAIAKEMSHRVKNVFNILGGMIQFSAKGAASKEALAEALSGRVHALAAAHGLVRRSFGLAHSAVQTTELTALMSAILRPHEALPGQPARFTVTGPLLALASMQPTVSRLSFTSWRPTPSSMARWRRMADLSRSSGSSSTEWRCLPGGRWVDRRSRRRPSRRASACGCFRRRSGAWAASSNMRGPEAGYRFRCACRWIGEPVAGCTRARRNRARHQD